SCESIARWSGTLAPVPRRCVPPAPAPPSAADTPARTVCACFPSWLLLYLPNSLTVHETGSTPVLPARNGFVFALLYAAHRSEFSGHEIPKPPFPNPNQL